MGLLRPQLHGNADFIVERLNEWLPGIDRAALLAWPAHARTACRFGSESGSGFVRREHIEGGRPRLCVRRSAHDLAPGGLQEML